MTTRAAESLDALRDLGVLDAIDVHVAEMVTRRGADDDCDLATAVALAVKAVRHEHVCVDLDADGIGLLWRVDGEPAEGPSDPVALRAALARAHNVAECVSDGADVDDEGGAPLVVAGTRLYLRKFALDEQLVAQRLRASHHLEGFGGLDEALSSVALDADDAQRDAVRRALATRVSVIAGGPGTGKTTAVALLVRTARALEGAVDVALAAPTGKAAARLNEAIAASLGADDPTPPPRAITLHRLLGARPGGHRGSRGPLRFDVIVVDEASMVSLPMLAEVLRRARDDARVVLVGDPDQLASIEVGAVLSDVVEASSSGATGVVVSTLTTSHRFSSYGGVAALAGAVRQGDVAALDEVVARHEGIERMAPGPMRAALVSRVVDHAVELVAAAREGRGDDALALVSSLGLLCATRRGDGSTSWWRTTVEAHLVERGVVRSRDEDYLGRPIIVTRNDPLTGLVNGDIGVIVADGADRVAVFESGRFALGSLPSVDTVWALTIHKSQGSEYDEVVVSLPGPESPILTRELVYTAVTRARRKVTIVAPAGSVEAALARRVARSSGLAARLRAGGQLELDLVVRTSSMRVVSSRIAWGIEGST